MKKTLIVLCSALALVGCDRNRGGLGNDRNNSDVGAGSRDTTYPGTRSVNRDNGSLSTPDSVVSTNTNSAITAPAIQPEPGAQDPYNTEKNTVPKN